MPRQKGLLLAFGKPRSLNLRNLMVQQIDLPQDGSSISGEGLIFTLQREDVRTCRGKIGKHLVISGKRIKQAGLLFPREKALVVVRTVQINEPVAQCPQQPQRARRSVDKLTPGPGCRHRALQQQPPVLAGLRSPLLQKGGYTILFHILKYRLHRTGVLPGADQRFVRPLAEQQHQCPDQHAFARTGLPGDHGKTGSGLPEKILDQGKISNSE